MRVSYPVISIAKINHEDVRLKTKRLVITLYIFLAIIYLALIFLIPPDGKALIKYQLSTTSIRILSLSFALPILAIWAVAFFGFIQYRNYALTIKDSKDGAHHKTITNGLFVLALSFPISSIISNLLTYLGRLHPRFIPTSVIINNYVNLVISL